MCTVWTKYFNETFSNLPSVPCVFIVFFPPLLHSVGFVDVETPTLFKRTPGVSSSTTLKLEEGKS